MRIHHKNSTFFDRLKKIVNIIIKPIIIFLEPFLKFKWRILILIIGVNTMLVVLLIVMLFTLRPDKMFPLYYKIEDLFLRKSASIVYNLVPVSAPNIKLDISFKNKQKLAYKRFQTLKQGAVNQRPILQKTSEDWVPATLSLDNKEYKVKVRLKGRLADHWRNEDMWSLNVKVSGEETVFGMKYFSIQHPTTRNGVTEFLIHKFLKKLGLIYLRYDFVKVSINGNKFQLYAYEEGFGKRLIENNNRREGPIVKFNNDNQWLVGSHQLKSEIDGRELVVVPYKKNKILNNPLQEQYFYLAKTLLNKFTKGTLNTSQVFDVEKMAYFYAMLDVLGYYHGGNYDNMKFYYNPVTAKLEPVGYDFSKIIPIELPVILGQSKELKLKKGLSKDYVFIRQLFSDPEFYAVYMKKLETLIFEEELMSFFNDLNKDYKKRKRLLWKFGIKHTGYDLILNNKNVKAVLKENHLIIKNLLTLKREMVYAFLESQSKKTRMVRLAVKNMSTFPLKVSHVSIEDKTFKIKENLILQSRNYDDPPFPKRRSSVENLTPSYSESKVEMIDIKVPSDIEWDSLDLKEIKVHYSIFGGSQQFKQSIFPWKEEHKDLLPMQLIQLKSSLGKQFMKVDKEKRKITFLRGVWQISQPLILPKNYTVIIPSDVTINLINGAFILSYSPVVIKGTKSKPVYIKSSDKTGMGLAVINAKTLSSINNAIFENLDTPKDGAWHLTGSVTFYESPVKIENTIFRNNRAEDALNIFRSKFEIIDSLFKDIHSDAFDGDFVEGEVRNCRFNNIGNDAVDVSGSNLKVKNIQIQNAGDKAISVGEKSILRAENVIVKSSEIGVASKDSSEVFINNITLEGVKLGLTAYRKKSEFQGASISVSNLASVEVDDIYLVEKESTIIIDQQKQKTNNSNVKSKMYGVEYGKKSR